MTAAPDKRTLLGRNGIFAALDAAVLDSVAARLREVRVQGGQTLFNAGDEATGLYLLRSGSVGLFRPPQAGGAPHLAGILAAGEAAGVVSLLLDQPHDMAARALRDSELLYLSDHDYARLIEQHPAAMLGSARTALRQLLARGAREPRITPRTFALLPFAPGVPARDVAAQLQAELQPFGECRVIDAALGGGRDPAWFAQQEREARFVLYVDAGRDAAWRDLCRRQADALLLLVESDQVPAPWTDLEEMNAHADLARPRHLLLLHANGHITPGIAARWSAALNCEAQAHHIRDRHDLARVARLLARRSTGLVLSGGGARAFAAIGLIRALRECGYHIDRVGGTSMGAIVAAGVAMEWDDDAMYAHFRAAFVEHRPLSDWTVPWLALLRGERTSRLLMHHFGTGAIEDLALPLFCVSADLTRGTARVHRRGTLWRALRAASAVPGLLPPVLHEGHVLVDGGVINDLPIDVMYDHGVARILACDIRAEDILTTTLEQDWSPRFWRQWRQRRERPGIGSVLLRSGMVSSGTAARRRRELASWVFAPPLGSIGLLDFDAFDHAVELGYRYGMQLLPEANP